MTENRREEGKVEEFADLLRSRITHGEFGPRGRIPSVSDLARLWNTTRTTVYEAIRLLQSEGLLISRGTSLFVSYPFLNLDGITENFERFLQSQGQEVTMENMIAPTIEPMPHDIAEMFRQKEGVHVVHRMRKQGIPGLPLRIAENWYPASLAGEFIEQMRQNDRMDVVGAIKAKHGVYIVESEDIVQARIPTAQEARDLGMARTEPIVEIRRSNFAQDGTPVMWNKILHVAPHFKFTYRYPVEHWKK